MASNRNTVIRSLHDLGAAAWFGGNLMGAVGVNGASKDVKDPADGPRSHRRDGRAGRRSTRPPSARTWSARSASSWPTGTGSAISQEPQRTR
jgi:hypothetical protein